MSAANSRIAATPMTLSRKPGCASASGTPLGRALPCSATTCRWHVLRGTGVPGYLDTDVPALVIALASPGEVVDAADADLLWVLGDE